MEIWEACPQLVCLDPERTYYEGYISVLDQELHLSITLPPNRSLKNAQIDVEPKVFYILQEYQGLVKQRLNQCSGLATFLKELKVSIKLRFITVQPDFAIKLLPEYLTLFI